KVTEMVESNGADLLIQYFDEELENERANTLGIIALSIGRSSTIIDNSLQRGASDLRGMVLITTRTITSERQHYCVKADQHVSTISQQFEHFVTRFSALPNKNVYISNFLESLNTSKERHFPFRSRLYHITPLMRKSS
ncbi:hypothetical protein PMAYCL1PPCAC_14472, partial [Pristionchus mayeri]